VDSFLSERASKIIYSFIDSNFKKAFWHLKLLSVIIKEKDFADEEQINYAGA
jgi:hypothetical protein